MARVESGTTSDLVRSLAESYARARMRTLFIEADLGLASVESMDAGWSEILSGARSSRGPPRRRRVSG